MQLLASARQNMHTFDTVLGIPVCANVHCSPFAHAPRKKNWHGNGGRWRGVLLLLLGLFLFCTLRDLFVFADFFTLPLWTCRGSSAPLAPFPPPLRPPRDPPSPV
jgi:hypothetical protein